MREPQSGGGGGMGGRGRRAGGGGRRWGYSTPPRPAGVSPA